MPSLISIDDISDVLCSHIGSFIVASCPLAYDLMMAMSLFHPGKTDFAALHDQLYGIVITGISRATGGSMCIITDEYRSKKLTLKDIDILIDDLMGLMFERLLVFSVNFDKINEYALRVESYNAMRILYQKYRAYFTDEQYAFFIKIMKQIHSSD